jgi:hypothetical protein
MPHRLYHLVAARAGNRCEYCLAPEVMFNNPFEVEHIQPRHTGGADDESNLALSCRSCNASKHTATFGSDPVSGHTVRLFSPRMDSWDEHFLIDEQSAEIIGFTEIGRATVTRLRMNGAQQRQARRLWIYLFRFPADPSTTDREDVVPRHDDPDDEASR